MTTLGSAFGQAMRRIVDTGKSADMRSRRLLDIAQVVNVRIERPRGGPAVFLATVRRPFHWTDNEGAIRWADIPDVHMSAPVAIGDMVLLETIGRGFATTYVGSPATAPEPLHVSELVPNASIQVAAGGPGGGAQWHRRLGTFAMRGESSAFVGMVVFDELNQSAPAMTSSLPETGPVRTDVVLHEIDVANQEGFGVGTGSVDLSDYSDALTTGIVLTGGVPFRVALAALGPYGDDGLPVRPDDPGASWIHGESGGTAVHPGHIAVRGNPGLTVPVDDAIRVGPGEGGRRYDLYLLLVATEGTPTYTAARMRISVLEAA